MKLSDVQVMQSYASIINDFPKIVEDTRGCTTNEEMDKALEPWRKKYTGIIKVDDKVFNMIKSFQEDPKKFDEGYQDLLILFNADVKGLIDPKMEHALFTEIGRIRKNKIKELKQLKSAFEKKMSAIRNTITEADKLELKINWLQKELEKAGLLESEEGPNVEEAIFFDKCFETLEPEEAYRIANKIYERTKLGLWR